MAAKKKEELIFIWEGIKGKDTKGKDKKRKGERTGKSEAAITKILRKEGYKAIKVKKKPKPLFGGAGPPVEPSDIALFARQMATMMTSGVPLLQSFDLVGQGHEKPAFQKLVMAIKA
ncbi:type II secretion system F family protein, partial [Candidatus Marithioploca araucensis]|nr:type II secretion system F family protein [Candidatus Marithioploca araucensis]